jgi:hypothetical protein
LEIADTKGTQSGGMEFIMADVTDTREGGDWRTCLRRDGYVHFRRLCPEKLVSAACLAIDCDLSTNYDPSRQIEYDHRSYCPDLRGTLR